MPGLLVSVRSAEEARAAVQGGAAVIDVKEPNRGPLGLADWTVWKEVRQIVPRNLPVSVALGELRDWRKQKSLPSDAFAGVSFRKLGLASSGPGWRDDWANLRRLWNDSTPWIAVVYADWEQALAPHPDSIIETAAETSCVGVLIDSWDKTRVPSLLDRSWLDRVRKIRETVGLVAIAGGLDRKAIHLLRPLGPDLFAVRGAACEAGNRLGKIDPHRVAELVRECSGI